MNEFICGLVISIGIGICASGEMPNVIPASSSQTEKSEAVIIRVVDGDTVVATARGSSEKKYVRLLGIDAPEIRGDCRNEIAKAHRAKEMVAELLPPGTRVTLVSGRNGWRLDRYGRILAGIEYRGRDVGKQLVAAGLARIWTPRPPKGNIWCGGAS